MHLINMCKSRKETTDIKGVYLTFVHPFRKLVYIYRRTIVRHREMVA